MLCAHAMQSPPLLGAAAPMQRNGLRRVATLFLAATVASSGEAAATGGVKKFSTTPNQQKTKKTRTSVL